MLNRFMNPEATKLDPTKAETEKPARKIFLEVGIDRRIFYNIHDDSGDVLPPVPVGGDKNWDSDEVWVGVELNWANIIGAKDEASLAKRVGERHAWKSNIRPEQLLYVMADGQKVPLPDHSVETVFFGNQFGDPDIPGKVKRGFLKEAHRVIKPEGQVVIVETRTPEFSRFGTTKDIYGSYTRDVGPEVGELLDETGFSVVEYAPSNDPRWNEVIGKYSAKYAGSYHGDWGRGQPYLIIAKIRNKDQETPNE